MRARFFGPEASTSRTTAALLARYPDEFRSLELDIRDADGVAARVRRARARDRAGDPHRRPALARLGGVGPADGLRGQRATARSTCWRRPRSTAPGATFVFCSTNKVYGDLPNSAAAGRARHGAWSCRRTTPTTRASTRRCRSTARTHSLFGVSKAAADLLVQEYGRYFDMPTVCFRGGCLTGPNHAGAQLHGFLSYLMRCTVTGAPYTVFGYGGKQVRDNIHAADLVAAFEAFHRAPRAAAPSTTSAAAAHATARCSRRSSSASEIAGRELDCTIAERAPHRRSPLVDQRPAPVHARLPRLDPHAGLGGHPARSPRRQRGALARGGVTAAGGE